VTSKARYGKCRYCGRWFALKLNGKLWSHRAAKQDGGSIRIRRCEGSGSSPA
jgi:hypothetical protein